MADLYYIEEGYYDAGYFVYTADAAAAVSSTSSVTAVVGKNQSIDLVAFQTASVSVTAERFRTATSTATSTSSVAAVVGKIIEQDDDLTLTWDDLSSWDNIPSDQWTSVGVWLQAPFTISALLEEVTGEAVFGEGAWSSEFTQTVEGALTKSTTAALASEFSQSASALANKTAEAAILSTATQTAEVTKETGTVSAALSSQISQTAVAVKTVSAVIVIDALFTPSVTVQALKNQTAIFEDNFVFTANVVANRSASITLDTIAALNAQNDKFVGVSSDLTSSFTTTAQATGLEFAEATLASAFTQTTSVLKLKRAAAALSSQVTLSATAIDLAERPRQFTQVGTPTFSTSVKKFGTHSYYSTNTNNYVTIPDSNSWSTGTWRTFDAWVYIPTDPSQIGGINQTLLRQFASNSSNQSLLLVAASSGIKKIYRFQINVTSGSSTVSLKYEDTTFGIIGFDTWAHIRVLNDGSAYHLWIDGSKKTLTSDGSTTYISNLNIAAPVEINRNSLPGIYSHPMFMDELLITSSTITGSGVTSFTPPTSAWLPNNDVNQSDILVLSHFDGDFSDDMMIIEIGQAALASTTAVSASADKTQGAFAATTVASAFTQTAIATKTTGTSTASLSSEFNLNVEAESSVNSLMASSGTMIVQGQIRANRGATLGNVIQLSAILNNTAGSATAFLQSQATISCTPFKADKNPAPIPLDNYRLYHLDFGLTPFEGQPLRATYFQERGKFGYDAVLNPTGSETLGYVPGFYPASGDDWSIEFWHRGRTNNTGSTDWRGIATIFGNRWLEYDGNANRYRIRGLIATGSSGGFNSGAPGAGYYPRLAFNWTHIAIQRKADVFTFFVNGVSAGSLSDSITTTSEVSFGTNTNGALTWTTITGAFDEVRINTLEAYYTGNFTPATAAYATEAQDFYTVESAYGLLEPKATIAVTPVKLVVTSAALSAAFTGNFTARKTVRTTRTLNVTASITPTAGKRVAGDTAVSSTTAFVASANPTRLFDSALSVTATQAAAVQRFRDPTATTVASTVNAVTVTGFLKQFEITLSGQGGFAIDAVANLAGVALLESTSELAALPNVTRLVTADLTAEATTTTVAGFQKQGESALTSQAVFEVTSFIKVPIQFAADLAANTAIAVDYTRIRDADSAVSVDAAVTAVVNKNPDAFVPLTAAFTSNTINDRLRDTGQRNLEVIAEQAQSIDIFRGFNSDLALEATASATITRIKPLASAVSAEFAVAFLGGRLNDIDLVSPSFASISATAVKTARTGSTITSNADVTANNVRVRYADTAITASSAIEAIAVKTAVTSQAVTVTSTVTATAQATRDIISTTVAVNTNLACGAVKIARYGSNLNPEFTLVVEITVSKAIQAEAALVVSSAMSAVNDRRRNTAGALAVTVTSSANIRKITGFTIALACTTSASAFLVFYFRGGRANLVSQGFVLTAGEVINIDPRLQLVIRPETRYLIINSETRVLTVV